MPVHADIYTHVLACSYIAEEVDGLFREQISAATQGGMKVRGLEQFQARTAELCARLEEVQRILLAERRAAIKPVR